jgi:predicted transcriptional regulator
MTKLLDKALEAVRQLPPESQDHIARLLLQFADGEREPEEIEPEHLSAVMEGLAQAERGQFATDEQVEALFAR